MRTTKLMGPRKLFFLTFFLTTIIANAQCWQYATGGGNSRFAIRSDGTLHAWGNNYYNQLGIGASSATSQLPPQQTQPGSSV